MCKHHITKRAVEPHKIRCMGWHVYVVDYGQTTNQWGEKFVACPKANPGVSLIRNSYCTGCGERLVK